MASADVISNTKTEAIFDISNKLSADIITNLIEKREPNLREYGIHYVKVNDSLFLNYSLYKYSNNTYFQCIITKNSDNVKEKTELLYRGKGPSPSQYTKEFIFLEKGEYEFLITNNDNYSETIRVICK